MFSRKLEDAKDSLLQAPQRIGGAFFAPRRAPGRQSSSVQCPILLGLAFQRRRVWVLALDPVGRSARTIGRVTPFRHDAFEPELAGVLEHERAVRLLHVLVEAKARRRTREHARKRRPALCEQVAPQVVAVQLDQVEGVEGGSLAGLLGGRPNHRPDSTPASPKGHIERPCRRVRVPEKRPTRTPAARHPARECLGRTAVP
jgi:hypothetical protein